MSQLNFIRSRKNTKPVQLSNQLAGLTELKDADMDSIVGGLAVTCPRPTGTVYV